MLPGAASHPTAKAISHSARYSFVAGTSAQLHHPEGGCEPRPSDWQHHTRPRAGVLSGCMHCQIDALRAFFLCYNRTHVRGAA